MVAQRLILKTSPIINSPEYWISPKFLLYSVNIEYSLHINFDAFAAVYTGQSS